MNSGFQMRRGRRDRPLGSAVAAGLAGVIALTALAVGDQAAAQVIQVPGLGSIEITGGDWRKLGHNAVARFYATRPTTFERRGESGVYVLVVWDDPALVADGISAEIAGYGYDCGARTLVEMNPTDLDLDGKPLPHSGGYAPFIMQEPKGFLQRQVLKSVCDSGWTYPSISDPLNDD